MTITLELDPHTERCDFVVMATDCRLCGQPLAPLSMSTTDGAVATLAMQCTGPTCRRSYVLRAELCAINPDALSRRHKRTA